ncbi:SPOR domain-containing protein [Brachymonas denitrificans]|uniref:SPOR domain-containing protein n=1 Tax=Brachymonas denitrificans TaxID=28220 RepID=UPI002AFE2718|nr:SPOR domain-containing protein [Brachymonas denitrificans]
MAAVRLPARPVSSAPLARQRGIGLLGFIVGIVVGLAVALAVAVYVTKVPTPFTDKSVGRTAQQQAEEDARLKNWDPNAGLQGKKGSAPPPVQEAPKDEPATQPDPAEEPKAKPAPDTTDNHPEVLGDREQELAKAREEAAAKAEADLKAQEQARAKARAEAKAKADAEAKAKAEADAKAKADRANASTDPIGALVESRTAKTQQPAPAPAPKPQAAPSEPFVYFVQAGAFRNRNEADAQRARLSLLGMSARITERDQAGRTIYRVRLGPFSSKADADSARSRVEGNGMEAALVRVQR